MKFMKLGSKPDCFESEGNNTRYVASELASDIVIFVGDVKFYLHKFPLLSKSARLQKVVTNSNEGPGNEVYIHDIPGGPTAFEICAKFCYGVTVTLNAHNVISSRCAAEYLEMNEDVEKGNLIYKIDIFLNSSILKSWKDSIICLQTTNSHLPMSEELKLVSHCIEAIASKASTDPSKVDWSYMYNREKIDSLRARRMVPKDWWVDDLCELEVDLYERVINSIKNKGIISDKVIGEALKAYASRRLQKNNGDAQSILDTIVWLLPAKKGSVTCGFMLKLLKLSLSLDDSGGPTTSKLVKRIAHQLEEASVIDLLSLQASDVVKEIVEEFMLRGSGPLGETGNEIYEVGKSPAGFLSEASKVRVTKLIDGYLAGISEEDPNLQLTTFIELAEMASDFPRPSHDGLYRAIDIYLKKHPGMSKSERKRICKLMDCKKLSAEACKHAVQNERLPMRVVVQVLFFEQVRANSSCGCTTPDQPKTTTNTSCGGSSRSVETSNTEEEWDTAGNELKGLRVKNAGQADNKAKMKGLLTSNRIFSKMLRSSKRGGVGLGENSGSDSSDSLVSSTNMDEAKSTLVRRGRHSVS
ncbi:unnamed protein product [Cuscuta europaea]|uniref:Uncharacterized protein n=1 Tax=Cuscuta europaea TaxID=41803 RepID=A0A9P1EFC1_CUSEU|nr:unnamed protein product [Cuscuta europaea]